MSLHWQAGKSLAFFNLKKKILKSLPKSLRFPKKRKSFFPIRAIPCLSGGAADDICYQIMDMEDAYKLNILSYDLIRKLFLNFYDTDEDKKALKSIDYTLQRVSDKNEQISYLRAGVIGKLIHESLRVFNRKL